MPELNPNAKRWVEALRSGDYKQGRRVLRTDNDGYCCLGVACDIYPDGEWIEGVDGWLYVADSSGPDAVEEVLLPVPVMRWLGLKNGSGRFGDDGDGAGALTTANDAGLSFGRIADIIESTPELFVSSDT